MREYFTYGSVRGAAGNGGPYRDPRGPRGPWTPWTSNPNGGCSLPFQIPAVPNTVIFCDRATVPN